ncbi:MAG TPA: hypothetical protein VGO50_02590 [Pyrinomonadaceae bacterium]|jgi:hypothetical protein|nr:hypothetical protein [Pyrinomonadaceae bacterium]
MRLGYSLLLGEFIHSEIINYVDCKAFQIVCPSCKEPIFKVVRDANPLTVHYLSHYEKNVVYDADCELRVSGISNDDIETANNGSRDQKLRYFLGVLRNAVLTTCYDLDGGKKAENFASKIRRSNALKKYRNFVFSSNREVFASMPEEEITKYFDGYIDDIIQISGSFTPTVFSLTTQKKIAQDIWLHLLSAKAEENFMFLFSHAYLTLIARFEIAHKERGILEYERMIYSAMERMFETNTRECDEILRGIARMPIGPPYAIEGSNLFRKMTSEIEHEMLGLLLQLPYFEMIKEAQNLLTAANNSGQQRRF